MKHYSLVIILITKVGFGRVIEFEVEEDKFELDEVWIWK